MRALSFSAPGVAEVVEVPPPEPAEGELLIAPRFVGLCGTDAELYAGTMPYFAEGAAAYPIQPGHEVTGIVVHGEGDVPVGAEVLVDPVVGCGYCVACRSGFQTRCSDRRELGLRKGMPGGASELIAVPRANVHRLPPGVSMREAVLAEPGVTVLNGVNRAGVIQDESALVVGAGTLGLIAAQLLTHRGARVDVLVVQQERGELVARVGARPVGHADDSSYSLVVEAAGASDAFNLALRAVAPGGRLVLLGVQPGPVEQVDVNAIVLKDATVFGIVNGPGLYDSMLSEIADGAVDSTALIDGEFALDEAEAALQALVEPRRPAPKVLIRIDS